MDCTHLRVGEDEAKKVSGVGAAAIMWRRRGTLRRAARARLCSLLGKEQDLSSNGRVREKFRLAHRSTIKFLKSSKSDLDLGLIYVPAFLSSQISALK